MVEIQISYEGQLHTRAVHGPSGSVIQTDAPKDNMGRGEAFSPTDLLATSLATCMITTMGILAQREGFSLEGSTVRVTKEMTQSGPRRIDRLAVFFEIPGEFDDVRRQKLTNAAHSCPVHRSLHPDVKVETTFNWTGAPANAAAK
jgi:putative redox protein